MREMAGYLGSTYDVLQKRLRRSKADADKICNGEPRIPKKKTPSKRKASVTRPLTFLTAMAFLTFPGKECEANSSSPTKRRKGTAQLWPFWSTVPTIPDDLGTPSGTSSESRTAQRRSRSRCSLCECVKIKWITKDRSGISILP